MTRNEELEIIWQKAESSNPCLCKTDNYWEQDITGPIRCARCHERITEEIRPTVARQIRKVRDSFENQSIKLPDFNNEKSENMRFEITDAITTFSAYEKLIILAQYGLSEQDKKLLNKIADSLDTKENAAFHEMYSIVFRDLNN